MICNNCGGENPDNMNFCKYCGSSLIPDFSESSSVPPVPERNYSETKVKKNKKRSPKPVGRKGRELYLGIFSLCLGLFANTFWLLSVYCFETLTFTLLPASVIGLIFSIMDANIGVNKINKAGKIFCIIGIVINALFATIGWLYLMSLLFP